MRLTLRRVGGFTGPAGASTREIDTASLPPDAARELLTQINAAHLFDLPARLRKPAPQPWDFLHFLSVDDERGRQHAVEFHLDAASPELKRLVEAIDSLPGESTH